MSRTVHHSHMAAQRGHTWLGTSCLQAKFCQRPNAKPTCLSSPSTLRRCIGDRTNRFKKLTEKKYESLHTCFVRTNTCQVRKDQAI